MEYVFGYASLSALLDANGCVTELHGARRGWGVAADNSTALPGYKRYRLADGSHPPVRVAFLDLAPGEDADAVNGVCLPVTQQRLAALDRRERNYARVEVSERIARPLGRTWTYVGSEEGRARLAAGRRDGDAVVSREYLDVVLAGFARLGAAELARFHATTTLDDLPVWELERVDLGDRPAPRAGRLTSR
jgi:gamma-glutamylcyclotransferase (GGCT)/AIG2-like uncharacterized protein YtfP